MHLPKPFFIPNWLFLLLLLFFSRPAAFAQLTITGPNCVLTTLVYQYNINGERKPNDTIRVCVEGGVLTETGTACTEKDDLSSVRVKWSEGKTTGKLTLSSQAGTITIGVNIATVFNPGIIQTTDKQVINYNKVSPSLSCTPASGGSCSPSFKYQWEWSFNRLSWKEVAGATGRNLSFSTPLKQTVYFRRKVVESTSQTTGYSNIITVLVRPEVKNK